MIDLTWDEAQETFRREARSWLAENLPAWRAAGDEAATSGDGAAGFAHHLRWERMLFDARWAVVSWPQEFGGRSATPWEWLIFEEEYYLAGGPPRVTQNGLFILAPALFEFGTEEQRRYILPRMASGADMWCQGWSEPGAGSDLASLRSRATRVDGGWVLNGQKTWTTRGAFSTHLFGLFRSDPASSRHHGLTYLLVPLDLPGIRVRGFNRLDGDEEFAEVFFDDAFVPDDLPYGQAALGDAGRGWSVAMSSTTSERGLTLRSPARFVAAVDRLVRLWRDSGQASERPDLSARLADAWMHAEAYRLQTLRTVSDGLRGVPAGAETSLVKVWWSELDVEITELALDMLGPEAEVDGPWSRAWQFSLSGPIYAGTNEIQRNIAAERVLGLPRSR
jgi:alkylation response protein AidB-like acyl-CoA dehydrogenase